MYVKNHMYNEKYPSKKYLMKLRVRTLKIKVIEYEEHISMVWMVPKQHKRYRKFMKMLKKVTAMKECAKKI